MRIVDRAKIHSYIEMTYLQMMFLKKGIAATEIKDSDRVKGFVTDVSSEQALVTVPGLRGQIPARMLVVKYT